MPAFIVVLRRHWPFLLIVIAVLMAALPVLLYPMGRDQGMYANIGRSILNGGRPFVDMWDIKPPPIYYIYAAGIAVFGQSTAAIRAIDFVFAPLAMLAIYGLGWRLGGRMAGLFAALLYGVFYFNEQFASLTQNDGLVTMPLAWATWAVVRHLDAPPGSRSARGWAFVAGALFGLIVWFKQYFAFFPLAFAIVQIMQRRRLIVREALALMAGGLLTGGGLLLIFAAQGLIQPMLEVAQGTAAYNAQGYDFGAFIANMGNYWAFRWLHWGTLLVLAALWPLLWIIRGRLNDAPAAGIEGDRPEGRWRIVWAGIGAGLAFAFIQAKGFDTHWIPLLPYLAWLGGAALAQIAQRLSRIRPAQIMRPIAYGLAFGLPLFILIEATWADALPYLTGQEDRQAYYARFQANDLKPAQSLEVVEYLQARVVPGDTLYIWGFRPEIYFMGGWRPATRFQAQFPLVAWWYPEAWRTENVEILWAAMPPYALVLQDDFMPWVTDRHEDSHQLLQEYIDLNNWLIANYEREGQIGDFLIWRRKP